MKQSTLFVPNAILFVVDPKNRNAHVPTYESGLVYAATESCISIATRADVDGTVTVTLEQSKKDAPHNGQRNSYAGMISTLGKRLAIVTSALDIVLECNVGTTSTEVIITVDDDTNPSKVHVRVMG